MQVAEVALAATGWLLAAKDQSDTFTRCGPIAADLGLDWPITTVAADSFRHISIECRHRSVHLGKSATVTQCGSIWLHLATRIQHQE